jgi:dolichyl-phosphate-mannose--protein O-mannosyl transferase/Gpi18-like mannosyltransferase
LTKEEKKSLINLLLVSFVIRILFSLIFNTGHYTDLNNFKAWSMGVTDKGLYTFFLPQEKGGTWCDYPPGYIYILYLIGSIYKFIYGNFNSWNSNIFTTFIKFPGIISDVINVYLIFKITRIFTPFYVAISVASMYSFSPPIFYESAVWGQMDSLILTFILLSIIFMFKQQYDLSILMTSIGILLKPQGVVLLLLLMFIIFYKKEFKKGILGAIYSFILVFLITYPVTKDLSQVIPWLWNKYIAQAELYPYSSIQAFNIWSFTGMWKSDSRTILGITHKNWGILLFSTAYLYSIYFYLKFSKRNFIDNKNILRIELENEIKDIDKEILSLKEKDDKESKIRESQLEKLKKYKGKDLEILIKENEKNLSTNSNLVLLYTVTIILISFFLFPVRMHERYLFSGFSMLFIISGINFKFKNILYIMSITFTINLLFEFPGVRVQFPPVNILTEFLLKGKMINPNFGLYVFNIFSIINLAVFFKFLFDINKRNLLEIEEIKEKNENERKLKISSWSVPEISKFDSKDLFIILFLSFVSTLLRLFYLKFPEEMMFDEVYHARAAGEYLRHINPYEWVHPPLAKLIISIGVYIFGLNSFGWRIMPLVFGTFFIPVMYVLGKSLFSSRYTGLLAALLISIDGVFFVQSKTAMTNIFATFFQVTAIMFFWLYFQYDYYKKSKIKIYIFLLLSGLFISLALATRWTSMGAFAFIIGATIWYKLFFSVSIKDIINKDFSNLKSIFSKNEIPFYITFIISFIILPISIYIISYLPYLNLGHTITDIWNMQKGIYSYHKNLRDPHPYYSEWYTWPFLIRPTWYYFRDFKDGTMAGIIALGNPAIWWSSVFVTIYSLYNAIKYKKTNLLYVGLGYVILYLPWAVSPRIKNYSHYLFEAIPYACLALSFLIYHFYKKGNQNKQLTKDDISFNKLAFTLAVILSIYLVFIALLSLWHLQLKYDFPIKFLEPYKQYIFNSTFYSFLSLLLIIIYYLYENAKYKTLALIYLSICIAMFVFFYPLYSGYPMYWWYYSLHIWLPSWI